MSGILFWTVWSYGRCFASRLKYDRTRTRRHSDLLSCIVCFICLVIMSSLKISFQFFSLISWSSNLRVIRTRLASSWYDYVNEYYFFQRTFEDKYYSRAVMSIRSTRKVTRFMIQIMKNIRNWVRDYCSLFEEIYIHPVKDSTRNDSNLIYEMEWLTVSSLRLFWLFIHHDWWLRFENMISERFQKFLLRTEKIYICLSVHSNVPHLRTRQYFSNHCDRNLYGAQFIDIHLL